MKRKAISYAKIPKIDDLKQEKNGNIPARFEEIETPADICCYAIMYHSEMTYEDNAFVCVEEEPLPKTKKFIYKVFNNGRL